MAQNIRLKDRVRFFPGLKKKDLPPMFDSTFVATIPFYSSAALPGSFLEWDEEGFGNYNTIIGSTGDALISGVDYGIWTKAILPSGIINVINGSINNQYPVYYGPEVNPNTDSHSGFMFYTIYDLNIALDITGKPTYSFLLDVYESKVLINDATDYDDIK